MSYAAGPQLTHMHQKAMPGETRGILRIADGRAEKQLDVGPLDARNGRDECAAFAGRRGKQSAPTKDPVEHMQDIARQRLPRNAVGRCRSGAIFERYVEMVLQVLANACKVLDCRNAMPLQLRGIPDAREQQQMRRHKGSGRENDLSRLDDPFFRPVSPGDPGCAIAFHHHARDLSTTEDRQVGSMPDRVEIGAFRRDAFAIALGEGVEPRTGLACAVEIGIAPDARHLSGFEIDMRHRIDAAERRDVE